MIPTTRPPTPQALRLDESLEPVPAEPWTRERYPHVMLGLPPEVREHAIEVANALCSDGHSEARAIALGIARAREWCEKGASSGGPLPDEALGATATRHVVYEDGAWSVALDGVVEPLARFASLEDALHLAHELARQDEGSFYVYVDRSLLGSAPLECFDRPWTGGPSLFQVVPYDGGWAVHRIAGDSHFFETIDDPVRDPSARRALLHGATVRSLRIA